MSSAAAQMAIQSSCGDALVGPARPGADWAPWERVEERVRNGGEGKEWR